MRNEVKSRRQVSGKTKTKPNNRKECQAYELDLTDYVRGDTTCLTKEKQVKLFAHLRQCAQCREAFFDWEETYGAMVTKQHFAQPETKKRYAELLAKIKGKKAVAKQPIDDEQEVGSAAGAIYRYLKENGETPYPVIRDKTRLWNFPFYEAMGWLLREKKVHLNKDRDTLYAALTPSEREKYQAQTQV
jgi:hypothetical protein